MTVKAKHLDIISYPARAAGTMTRILQAGSGEEAVVFLHGVGARADRWSRNLTAIASAGYHCFAMDLPGHGFAQKGEGFAYGVPGYADYVEAWLDEAGIGAAHFVGTSLGAHILASVTCRRPSRVRSLTLVGATGLFPVGVEARDRIAGRILDRSREGIRRKLGSVMFDAAAFDESLVEEEWKINNSPGAEEAFAQLAAYFRDQIDSHVVGPALAAMTAPCPRLIVWGEQDRSVPLSVGLKVQELLGNPLVVIPQTAHAPYWEAPDVFNKVLLDFLQST